MSLQPTMTQSYQLKTRPSNSQQQASRARQGNQQQSFIKGINTVQEVDYEYEESPHQEQMKGKQYEEYLRQYLYPCQEQYTINTGALEEEYLQGRHVSDENGDSFNTL